MLINLPVNANNTLLKHYGDLAFANHPKEDHTQELDECRSRNLFIAIYTIFLEKDQVPTQLLISNGVKSNNK